VSIETFEANLRSGEIEGCIQAVREASDLGWPAARIADAVLRDSEQPKRSRAWALQALSLFQATHAEFVASAAIAALRDSYAGVRANALAILGRLRQADAVKPISALLTDMEVDPTAWDDRSTVAEAAARALQAIGTAEALRELHKGRSG
jgi:HEAT repeat protein